MPNTIATPDVHENEAHIPMMTAIAISALLRFCINFTLTVYHFLGVHANTFTLVNFFSYVMSCLFLTVVAVTGRFPE
jgi:ABC-type uncharacterized transport system permease subunit